MVFTIHGLGDYGKYYLQWALHLFLYTLIIQRIKGELYQMPMEILPEERKLGRTTVLNTLADKEAYDAYCQSIGEKPGERLREFMLADMAEYRRKHEGK